MSFDIFDAIIYINLYHRKDRNAALLKELEKLEINPKKIFRIEGVFDIFNGHRGCAQSHIQALDFAQENRFNQVLILEDDAVFPYDKQETEKALESAFSSLPLHWNMLLLGGNVMLARETPSPFLKQVLYAQSAHAYVIHKEYISHLKTCFKKSLELMLLDSDYLESQKNKHSIDHQWKSLQTKDLWFVGKIIAQQRQSYSDITNTVYGSNFEDVGLLDPSAVLKEYKVF
jgi:GR25 family glycosyltransferase involved in LPS biosynthesis